MPIFEPSTSFNCFKYSTARVQIGERAIVGEIDSLCAFQNGFAVAGKSMKKIGRESDETRLRQFGGQIFGMLIDAVALVQNNHRRPFAFGFRQCSHGADAAAEFDHLRYNSGSFLHRHGPPLVFWMRSVP